MLDELTPDQAFELFCYHAMEPFGEVRQDYRMAKISQLFYNANRGKTSPDIELGQFTMYDDIVDAAAPDPASPEALMKALGHG